MANEPIGELADHVLVLAPRQDDARALCRTLAEAGLPGRAFASPDELSQRLDAGDAGAVLLTADALTSAAVATLVESLEAQPLWSDVPVVVLAGDEHEAGALAELRLACHLVRIESTASTLVPALESALRARRRQYEVRDRLAELQAGRRPGRDEGPGDEFLSWVNHELQTPVSAILLWSRMISGGIVPVHELPKALASIESSARTQSYQIHDLLDASRLASGKLQLNLQPAPLAPAVAAAVQVARSQADGKKVRLAVSLEPSPGLALVDSDRAQRIVWNLLTEAIRSTVGGGEVRLGLDLDEAWVRLTVASSGADAETGGSSSTAAGPRSARLGLRLCEDLVELHGGTLETTPPGPGRGVVFTARLPAATRPG